MGSITFISNMIFKSVVNLKKGSYWVKPCLELSHLAGYHRVKSKDNLSPYVVFINIFPWTSFTKGMSLGTTANFGNIVTVWVLLRPTYALPTCPQAQRTAACCCTLASLSFHPAWTKQGVKIGCCSKIFWENWHVKCWIKFITLCYFSLKCYYQHPLKLFFKQHLDFIRSISKTTHQHHIRIAAVLCHSLYWVKSVIVLLCMQKCFDRSKESM